jgi:hypothetical protein
LNTAQNSSAEADASMGKTLFKTSEKAVSASIRTYRESVNEALLAHIAQISGESETTFEEMTLFVNDIIKTALRTRDWESLDKILEGQFEYLDALKVPIRADVASVTNIKDVSKYRKQARIPEWISAYARIVLSLKNICGRYLKIRPEILDDPKFEEMFEQIRQSRNRGAGKLTPNGLEYALGIKLLSESVEILERSVLEKEGDVTQDPALVLLLTCYETLDFQGFRPSFFRKNINAENGYVDLIRAFFERFPAEEYPGVYEYLSKFSVSNEPGNCLSSILNRVEYVEAMERIAKNAPIA